MAESLISLYQGTKAVIEALTESVDGALYYSTDSQDLYKGDGTRPKKMTGFIFADTKPANPVPDKPYLIAGILYIYTDGAWIDIGSGLGYTAENVANKNQNNGYAGLDAGGKIAASQLPSTVMEFKGTWNASTNTPTLADGVGDVGDVYLTNVGGTVNLGSGSIEFVVGDWAVYNGTIWERSPNSNYILSVNGQQGVVVLDADDIDDSLTTNKFVSAAEKAAITHSNRTALDTVAGTNTGDETAVTLGAKIAGATEKGTLVDTDKFGVSDSEKGGVLKWFSWAKFKAFFYHAGNLTKPVIDALNVNADTLDSLHASQFTRRIDLTGQLQLTSYRKSVIAICELTNTNIQASSWSSGKIVFKRYNGLYANTVIEYSSGKHYNSETFDINYKIFGIGVAGIVPCTFTYDGVKYGGFEIYIHTAASNIIEFEGLGNFELFGKDYYQTNISSVINSEIYNSLDTTTAGYILNSSYKLSGFDAYHSGNSNLSTVDWAAKILNVAEKITVDGKDLLKQTSVASSETPTPTGDARENEFDITALATNAVFAAPSGTPADGNNLVIYIAPRATAYTLSFNEIYEGFVEALPTTTIANKAMILGLWYKNSKWNLVSLTNQA